jgi:hypothetical protein
MTKTMRLFIAILVLSFIYSCKDNKQEKDQNAQVPKVSVKTTSITLGNIENNINLNGKTIYLKKNPVISPIAGFIVKINVSFGDKVKKNDVLFEIKTRESKALENMDSSYVKTGIIEILATSSGIINELIINQTGIYIVEGSLLCTIVENDNFLVQVNVPFEFNDLLKIERSCEVFLPDATILDGEIIKVMPVINETSQTQNVLIKLITNRPLPENLNVIVQFVTSKHNSSYLLPKEAVLTNETQNEFWVMKIMNDTIAVKTTIIKGIENDSMIEVISPALTLNDIIITEGAYGLPDSTVIKIVK